MSKTATTACTAPARVDPRALNHLQSGTYARSRLIPGEDEVERGELEQQYLDAFGPTTRPQRDGVLQLVDLIWRRDRVDRAECAMTVFAVHQAADNLPEPVLMLACEVQRQQNDIVILQRLVLQVEQELAREDGLPQETLAGLAPILDRLLGWRRTVADAEPLQFLDSAMFTLEARRVALASSKQTLDVMKKAVEPAMEASKASASLLPADQAARIVQQRAALERAIDREYKRLRTLTEDARTASDADKTENHDSNVNPPDVAGEDAVDSGEEAA